MNETIPPRKKRLFDTELIIFVFWIAVTVIGLVLQPSPDGHGTHRQLGLPPCGMVLLFNRPCPGCGLTTSFTATLHGDFVGAFHAHPLGPLMYAGLTFLAIAGFVSWLKGNTGPMEKSWFNKLMTYFIIVLIFFGIVRLILCPNYGTQGERSLFFGHLR